MTRLQPSPALTRPLQGRPPGPDPARLAAVLARAWLEVEAGRRPLAQLAPLLSPAARRRLAGQLPAAGRPPADRPRVGRVFDSRPTPDACEATVLVERAGRTTAIAIRLERHRGAWRAVELMAPEAGLRALTTASLPAGHRFPDAFDEALEADGPGGTAEDVAS